MQIPASPKGTRDFYPEDMALRDFIFTGWRRTCRRFGFEEFDGPLFENLELYTQKSGAEIEKQLYSFTDKGGRQMALRPEMTPTLARMVAARGTSLAKPIRWFSIPQTFRYERMQRGRGREFYQLNMDILGVEEVTADAELIAASVAMMQDLGFGPQDFAVHISSRKLLEEYLLGCGVAQAKLGELYALLDHRHKMQPGEYERDLAALLPDSAVRSGVERVLGARSLDDLGAIDSSRASYVQMRELFGLLAAHGVTECALFDIGIVRGLAYYTGVVFELFDRSRSLRAIAGGGRYDHLVASYGGPATPATGFAAGDIVIGEMLAEKSRKPSAAPRSSAYVVCFEERYPAAAVEVARDLRAGGISAEYSLRKVRVNRQLELADAARAAVAVFVGGEEYAAGNVKVKRLADRQEVTVPRASLVGTVTGLLAGPGSGA